MLVVALVAIAETFGMPAVCLVSSLVIANPLGTFPDPLAFLFLLGPVDPEGDTCRDRFRGVIVVDVACEG